MVASPERQTLQKRNTAIPPELKDLHQWARWIKGSRDKMPANLDNTAMKWGTRTNWLTFDQVSRFDKIGYFHTLESGIIGVDFDGCRNKETGEIHPLVLSWIKDTFAEVSPNEEGVKAYFRGKLPNDKVVKNTNVPWGDPEGHTGIEMYCEGRFFTVTGNIIPGCPSEINEAPEVLNDMLVRFVSAPKIREKVTPEPTYGDWDIDRWVYQHLEVVEKLDDGYIIVCPWCAEHTTSGDTARIWTSPKYTFNCFHAHCSGREWSDVRLSFEPTAYDKREQWTNYSHGQDHSTNGNGHAPTGGLTKELLCKFTDDDAGNGDAMEALYGQDFLYCPARGWFYYTDTHWKLDPDGAEAKKSAVDTLRTRRHAAVDVKREDIVKCTKGEDKRVNGCINRFRTLVNVSIDDFDNNPDVINCKNGVVNLQTGEIKPHSHEQRFTYCIPVAYRPEAFSQEWKDYLTGVVGGGQVVIDYLQMALGYSLTGHTREEVLFYLYGPPRSGKGTLAEIFMRLMPDPISTMVDFNSFTAKREGDVSNFDLAPLKPSRLVFASESQKSQSLNPAKIKQLTGGDQVRACFKHKDFFSYRPQFKVWMMSNHSVNGDPEDDALWGRVRVIEFPNSFLGSEDKTKKERLKQPDALEAILAWAIEGTMKWYALGSSGLQAPEAVTDLTQKHRDELDYVQQWIEECCEEYEGVWTASEEVMDSYTTWCKNNNVQYIKSRKELTQSLIARGLKTGVQKKIDGKNKRCVEGLYVYPVSDDTEKGSR